MEEDPELLDQEAEILINSDNSSSDIQDRLQYGLYTEDYDDKIVFEDAGSGWS